MFDSRITCLPGNKTGTCNSAPKSYGSVNLEFTKINTMNDPILMFRPAHQNSAYNTFFPVFRDRCGDILQPCKVGAKNEQNESNLIEQNKSFALNFSLE